ncbi:hypothetical protein LR68_02773 [Anoxybacillus sp. BCO1]|nr:hypothetical protein LR68_02773 [Anoxybacillus sp. BCO1]
MKRKVTHDAAKTNNQTPTESMPKDEFEAQYAGGEDMSRGANRNSKKDGKENEKQTSGQNGSDSKRHIKGRIRTRTR